MTTTTNPAQKQAIRAILRPLAPVVGHRQMEDGEDLVLFITVRKPSRRLLAYRIHPDGTHEEPRSYHGGVHQGVRIRPREDYSARLPRFRDVAEAVRFLADFPMIPTAPDGALVQENDTAAGRMGSLGQVVETERGPLLNREGRPASTVTDG